MVIKCECLHGVGIPVGCPFSLGMFDLESVNLNESDFLKGPVVQGTFLKLGTWKN